MAEPPARRPPPASDLHKQGRGERGRFAPGASGNPQGKRPGTRNRTTIALEQLMAADAEAVVRAMIREARNGDVQAGRLI